MKTGRPKGDSTELITLRLPVTTMEIIKRRAEAANMEPSVWLRERVIYHEVLRSHGKRRTQ